MKTKHVFILFFIIAISLTLLGYLIDNDKAYSSRTQTALEFSVITFLIFAVQSAVFGIVLAVRSVLSNK